jgi:hypothetical protein
MREQRILGEESGKSQGIAGEQLAASGRASWRAGERAIAILARRASEGSRRVLMETLAWVRAGLGGTTKHTEDTKDQARGEGRGRARS